MKDPILAQIDRELQSSISILNIIGIILLVGASVLYTGAIFQMGEDSGRKDAYKSIVVKRFSHHDGWFSAPVHGKCWEENDSDYCATDTKDHSEFIRSAIDHGPVGFIEPQSVSCNADGTLTIDGGFYISSTGYIPSFSFYGYLPAFDWRHPTQPRHFPISLEDSGDSDYVVTHNIFWWTENP